MSESNIEFHSEGDFELSNPQEIKDWFAQAAIKEGKLMGALNYIFCDDTYLHKLNVEFLKHDTYTDIITFDYSVGNELIGDVYISVERVKENAVTFDVTFENELKRVLIHGLLHLCGYKDKTAQEADEMREKENKYLNILV
ncbi:MAG: rRNA maturation RNase YbeY [Flavobacteriales bacterium]|tara:strand:- start:64 stop:486 length:423 start_codon:yes stop_codon:yes gene_type:complete